MEAPQMILIGLLAFELGAKAVKHGQPRPNYNVLHAVIDIGAIVGLLAWGGFWT